MSHLNLASALAVAGVVLGTGASAASITYLGTTSFGGGTFTIDVTTDGAISALAWSDITAIDLTVTGGGYSGTAALGASDFGYQYPDGGLVATPTALQFDFAQADALFNIGGGDSGASICLGGANYGCGANTAPGEGFSTNGWGGASRQVFSRTTIATAVPEPALWTLMLVGVGGVGGRMRATRRTLLAG
jgi:hypothetical protein